MFVFITNAVKILGITGCAVTLTVIITVFWNTRTIRQEAVAHGAGQWIADKDGNVHFKWSTLNVGDAK